MAARTNSEIRKAVDTLFRLNADKEVRALYNARLMAELDRNSKLHEAREEGREEGRNEERQYVIELLKQGLSSEEIIQRLN